MTAENQGTGAPEGDDPFAYLYRQEGGGAEGGAATTPQPGVPRRSYNQVRAVGERQYGGGPQQYGGAQAPGQSAYREHGQGSPSAHYAAPETVPGGRAAMRRSGAGGPGGPDGPGRGRGGGNRNGLLIGAVAVVAAVVVGIGAAMLVNGDDPADTGGTQAGPTADPGGGQSGGGEENDGNENKDDQKVDLPDEDAAALRLGGKAAVQRTIPGAQGRNGAYVTGMNSVGSSAAWDLKVPKAGKYTVFVRYSVPGKDADSTLTVNGDPHDRPLNMKNFAGAEKDDWEKGWTNTFAWVTLKEGNNRVAISCGEGNRCGFLLDRVWLKDGWVEN
jgi:hypothetical protein